MYVLVFRRYMVKNLGVECYETDTILSSKHQIHMGLGRHTHIKKEGKREKLHKCEIILC